MKFRIVTGDWGGDYEAPSREDAIKNFIRDILANKIKLCQLGVLGECSDGSEPIPFRIAPTLYTAGIITAQQLSATFQKMDLDFSSSEIRGMLIQDLWMLDP